jgi:hypothetical protein
VKAYIVREVHGDGCCVEFALHNVVARRNGANELNAEFSDVECNRYPAFDEYAPQVPDPVLVEHGWWFQCMQCQQRICRDPEDSDGEPIVLDPVYAGAHVFCSPRCQEEFRTDRLYELCRGEMAATLAYHRWPGIKIMSTNGYRHPARVSFTFPGGLNQVDWTIGDQVVFVARQDTDAWNTFANKIKESRSSCSTS